LNILRPNSEITQAHFGSPNETVYVELTSAGANQTCETLRENTSSAKKLDENVKVREVRKSFIGAMPKFAVPSSQPKHPKLLLSPKSLASGLDQYNSRNSPGMPTSPTKTHSMSKMELTLANIEKLQYFVVKKQRELQKKS